MAAKCVQKELEGTRIAGSLKHNLSHASDAARKGLFAEPATRMALSRDLDDTN